MRRETWTIGKGVTTLAHQIRYGTVPFQTAAGLGTEKRGISSSLASSDCRWLSADRAESGADLHPEQRSSGCYFLFIDGCRSGGGRLFLAGRATSLAAAPGPGFLLRAALVQYARRHGGAG